MPEAPATASPRRDEIVKVSARLFSRDGYRETSIRDIAAALDIKSASLYYHFANKDQILFAIAHGLMEDFVAEVTPLLGDGAAADPAGAIEAAVGAHLRFDFANLDRVLVSAHERQSLPLDMQKPINALRARHRHAVQAVVEAGAADGAFAVDSPRLATSALLDLLTGVKEWYHPPRDGRLDALVDAYRGYALALLGRASERKVATAAGRSAPRSSSSQATR
jgi:AcrR family transcriptional regulator